MTNASLRSIVIPVPKKQSAARDEPQCMMDPKTLFPVKFDSLKVLLLWLVTAILVLVVFQSFRTWWRLRHIPGPFLASLTDLYRMSWVWTKRAHLKLQKCHEKYGKVVRIGPNTVAFSDPVAIPTVYPMRAGIPKVSAHIMTHDTCCISLT